MSLSDCFVKMIGCVSPNPGDTARLLDYAG
jgi:hypothetical protein